MAGTGGVLDDNGGSGISTAAGANRGPSGGGAGGTAASTKRASASGPMRVYLNSAMRARGSLSSAWKVASAAAASLLRPVRCAAWNMP